MNFREWLEQPSLWDFVEPLTLTFPVTPTQAQELMDGPNGYSSGRFTIEGRVLRIMRDEVMNLVGALEDNYIRAAEGGIETVSSSVRRSMLKLAGLLRQSSR